MNASTAVARVRDGASAPLGAVIGVRRVGETDIAVSGAADTAGAPVTVDTLFDLASVTKVAATTSALHRLAALGALLFDDTVERYLPHSPCAPGTTIRALLTHRAGLWEWQPLYFTPDPARTVDELPLRYAPDAERHYSDLGFMLLGRIIAAIFGRPLDAAVRELVHEPLGMTRTSFGPASGDVAASALGDAAERRMVATNEPYPVLFDDPGFAWRDGEIRGDANDGNCFHGFGGVSGHAGLFGAAADLLTLGCALAVPEPSPFWGPAVSADVFRDGPDPGQALGWRSMPVRYRGRDERMLWHPGYTGCAMGFLPGRDLAVTLLSNRLFAERIPTTNDLWAAALTAVPDLELLPESGGPT